MSSTLIKVAFWTAGVLGLMPPAGFADSLMLSAEGRKNLDVLRLRIAPAPLFEDPLLKVPYVRCIIVGARAARNPSARFDQAEGRPEYDIIAFDASGDARSETVTVSGLWIQSILSDIDSDLDVRALFSNRDELAGVALGSRNYFAMARRAGDPQGKLGLWHNDVALPPEPAGVTEGAVVRLLLDPPVIDASGEARLWNDRHRAAGLAEMKETMARRLPTDHPAPDTLVVGLQNSLLDAVARERAYRLSRSGFDRTALSMLVFLLDLSAVRHRENPRGDTPGDAIYLAGAEATWGAVQTIVAAGPMSPEHTDPPELLALLGRYYAAREPAEKKRLADLYDARQAQLTPKDRAVCLIHHQFCLDASQRAAVAIDALAASEAAYSEETGNQLLHALLPLLTANEGPDPHKFDRIDLRDPAFKLLVQLVHPPTSPDAERDAQRNAAAAAVRRELRSLVYGSGEKFSDRQEIARRALAAGGWGSPAELNELVESLLDDAFRFAADVARDPANDAGRRDLSAAKIIHLHAIAELATSQVTYEARAANRILDRVEEVRKAQKDRTKARRDYAVFLELWDDPSLVR